MRWILIALFATMLLASCVPVQKVCAKIIGWLDDGFIAVGVLIAGIWWIRRQP
jgi:hypothetical protein